MATEEIAVLDQRTYDPAARDAGEQLRQLAEWAARHGAERGRPQLYRIRPRDARGHVALAHSESVSDTTVSCCGARLVVVEWLGNE